MSAVRGLATVALLKVNFDAGRDHLAMFEPFVDDTLSHMADDGVTVDDVRSAVDTRHQLALPRHTVQALLGRAVKKDYLRREAGRYFRSDKAAQLPDLRLQREHVEERQTRLAQAFRAASGQRGLEIATDEDALAMILAFLERYHVSLALDPTKDLGPDVGAEMQEHGELDRRTLVTAAYLRETVLAEGEAAQVIQEMLEGFVLQNTLFLKDISSASRRFAHLRVFFDSGLLFGALGLQGPATEVATRELLSLLSESGASLEAFEPTLREMRRILAVYEEKIGTHAGRVSLYPTEMTRYFLTNHYSPSDVRTQASLLERNLRSLGVNIRDLPTRQVYLTLDEAELSRRLADRPGAENVPRVVHDVDCVAGVLTVRGGRVAESWDYAGAVFVTTSSLTVRNTSLWYEEQDGGGLPPIIHYLLLSNLAWLKRPASAVRLKLHELVALCVAALRPSRAAWQTFINHLKKLEESGELSSDEATAIIANGLTDNVLVEEQVDEDSDAATLSEVVDRVKAIYMAEADAVKAAASADVSAAVLTVHKHEAEALRLRMLIERRARSVAKIGCWLLIGLLATSLVAGTAIGLQGAVKGKAPTAAAVVFAVAPLAVVGLFSLFWGFNLNSWRHRLEERLTRLVRAWLTDTT